MFGYHLEIPRIPGRPLGCCTDCRQRARWELGWPDKVCPRCGLTGKQISGLRKVKVYLVFEDQNGNQLLKVRKH